ncbi:LCP family protein [Arthrobacter sp. 1P04PC]|uniref:LCP family protein n=1 Tax=unclassified Arthrobacter TaxID=235627 RepID=UPI0039A3F189
MNDDVQGGQGESGGEAGSGGAAAADAGPAGAGPGAGLRRRRILLIAAAALLVAVLAVAAILLGRPQPEPVRPAAQPTPTPSASPTPTPSPTSTPEPPATDLNLLIIGSDSRGNARADAVAGAPSDQRGDALIFVHLPADRQHVYGISIMRDLWVDIPDHGQAKVNAALELGGIDLQTRTVEALLQTHIDHTVMADFEGFAALADAVGGIDVDVTLPFTSTLESGHTFTPGINHLTGPQALDFVRERKAFADGDYQRVRDQQTFLKAVLAKAVGGGALADRATARAFVTGVLPHVSVTPGLTLDTLERLSYSMRGTPPGNAAFFTLPTAGIGTSTDGQSIVLQDPAATAEVAAALAAGTLPDYIAAHGLQNGN